MKKALVLILGAGAAALFATGCASAPPQDQGPYVPHVTAAPAHESQEPVVLMDPGVQYSVTCTGLQEQPLPDGRLQVTAHIRNREGRRIEVQANCVFKDLNNFTVGDETPYKTLILTENGTEDLEFVSMNDKARTYTIHVRQAR
jgi:hypothetical protein